jgi:predicted site-specific integrase-resolvase
MEPHLLDEQAVAKILGVSVKCLQAWRYKGSELKFVRVGRLIRYRPQDINHFVEINLRKSTVENA